MDKAIDESRKGKNTQQAPEVQKENLQTRKNEGRLLAASPHSFSFECLLSRHRVLAVWSLSFKLPVRREVKQSRDPPKIPEVITGVPET
jgi:hypothetical protein